MDPTLFPWLQGGGATGGMQNPMGSNPFNPMGGTPSSPGVPGAGLPGTGTQAMGNPSDPMAFMKYLMGSQPQAQPQGAAPGPTTGMSGNMP